MALNVARPFLVAAISALVCLSGKLLRAQGGVELSFDVPSNVTLHEPVVLRYTILNGLSQLATLDLGTMRVGAFQFVVFGPDGRRQQSYDVRRDGLQIAGRLMLQPHKAYFQAVVLDQWIDFSRVGSYTISAAFRGTANLGVSEAVGAPVIQANGLGDKPIRIDVLPRNEAKLREMCENLASRAEVFETGSDAAIEKLRYIRDPAAIPYLERVLSHHVLNTRPLLEYPDAIAEIGGPEARAVLIRLGGSSEPWLAFSATRALAKLR